MAIGDELDVVLTDTRLTDVDWGELAAPVEAKLAPGMTRNQKRGAISGALRHAYGHSAMNIGRDEFTPDYSEIVRATAKRLKLPVKEHHTVLEVERAVVVEVLDRIKAEIIKKEGRAAWEKIEREAEEELQRAVDEGRIPAAEVEALKRARGGAWIAALFAGKLAGFGLYMAANRLFFAAAKVLGWRVGVAAAGPVIGKGLAFVLGPAGWLIGAAWLAYDLGNTNWKKVVPGVVIVALTRARLETGG